MDWGQLSAFFVANWRDIFQVFVPVGIFGILAALGRYLWRLYKHRNPVVQILWPSDPRILVIEKLQQRFPPDERDPPGVLKERVASTGYRLIFPPRSNRWMIALCYVWDGKILGYLSAEYFVTSRTIFFWYLVHARDGGVTKDTEATDESVSMRDVAVDLIDRLLAICNRPSTPWLHLVAEVDSSTHEAKDARTRVRRFQQYAAELCERKGIPLEPRVFKLGAAYRMPVHDNDDLPVARQHETPAWLIYAPRGPEQFRGPSGYFADKSTVSRLIRTVLVDSYHEAEDPDYNQYVANLSDEIVRSLPSTVELIHDRKRM